MKALGAGAALGLQLAVLLVMIMPREWALHFGPVIRLRTTPVDPRDVMRGDYVRLAYEFSTVPREACRDGLARVMKEGALESPPDRPNWQTLRRQGSLLPADTLVYAVLQPSTCGDGTMELDHLTDLRPRDGVFLRGRIESVSPTLARVRYGLEAYFMQQGEARKLERSQTGDRASLEMEVALGRGGLAVLKGHRLGPLEIGLDLIRRPRVPSGGTGREGDDRVVAATLRLRNASSSNLAIVALPEGRSFALVPDMRWDGNPWRWAGDDPAGPLLKETDLIVLAPGEVHQTPINLADRRWWVVPATEPAATQPRPRPLTELTNTAWPPARFRFEYCPPPPEAVRHLSGAAVVWHGRLLTPAFTLFGNVD